jgi:RNA polymerase sigma-70 factor (ECF subfamily)
MKAAVQEVRERIIAALPRLRRFGRTLTRDVHDADDVVQLTIERALMRHDQWNVEMRFESWLFGIMRNAWIDEVRARKRRSDVFAPEQAGENVGEASHEAQVTAMSVEKAMAALPEEQREVIALVLVEGLAYREAADALDLPIGTVTSRLARGREALQTLLGAPAK